jgi:MFS family permease
MLRTGIFANRWWLVVGALLGLMVNTGVIEVFTFSVFLKPISEDLGFPRETIALAGVFGSLCATFATPAFGKAIDHFGLRKVHLPMICLYALSIALLGLLNTSFALMVTFFCFRGIVGSGQSPIAYSKAIAAWFDKDRGLALGVAIAGVGLGVALMPQIASWLIVEWGWREAFAGISVAIIVLGFIPALLFVREPPFRTDHVVEGRPMAPGSTFTEAVFHSWRFWAMTIAFFIGVVAINGMLTRVVPLLGRGHRLDGRPRHLGLESRPCPWSLCRLHLLRQCHDRHCALVDGDGRLRALCRHGALRPRHRRRGRSHGLLRQPLFRLALLRCDLRHALRAVLGR